MYVRFAASKKLVAFLDTITLYKQAYLKIMNESYTYKSK